MSKETSNTPLMAGYEDSTLVLTLSTTSQDSLSELTPQEKRQINDTMITMLYHFCRTLNKVAKLDPERAKKAATNVILALGE